METWLRASVTHRPQYYQEHCHHDRNPISHVFYSLFFLYLRCFVRASLQTHLLLFLTKNHAWQLLDKCNNMQCASGNMDFLTTVRLSICLFMYLLSNFVMFASFLLFRLFSCIFTYPCYTRGLARIVFCIVIPMRWCRLVWLIPST